MRIYDITLTISPDLPVWPGDARITLNRTSQIEKGDDFNVTRLEMCVHTGTHIDAPSHILGGDAPTVEELPLKTLTGRAYVLHLPDIDLITADVLMSAEIPPRTRRLLFRTRNSDDWKAGVTEFRSDFVAVSADGAQYLVDRGVKLVGVDYLSVAPFDDVIPTHKILLQGGVIVVEGLNLSQVSQGRYTLHCLPLKLAATEGAPARVIRVGV
jgi:arylformamidase